MWRKGCSKLYQSKLCLQLFYRLLYIPVWIMIIMLFSDSCSIISSGTTAVVVEEAGFYLNVWLLKFWVSHICFVHIAVYNYSCIINLYNYKRTVCIGNKICSFVKASHSSQADFASIAHLTSIITWQHVVISFVSSGLTSFRQLQLAKAI